MNVIGTENRVGLKKVEDGSAVINTATPYINQLLYMPTATVGITFNLGNKKNFDRFSSVGVYKADYDAVVAELNELRNRPVQVREVVREVPVTKEVVVEKTRVLVGSNITFPIGSCVLSETEAAKVDAFAKSLDTESLVQIVGSADTKTGTENRNYALAKNRANVVKTALVKAGVAEDRISVDTKLDATDNVRTSRSAIVTLSVD